QLIMLIDQHYIRINNQGYTHKSTKLQQMLLEITNSNDEALDKIQQLIYKSLPILAEPTWLHLRSPYSYRSVYNQMVLFGFKSIIDEMEKATTAIIASS